MTDVRALLPDSAVALSVALPTVTGELGVAKAVNATPFTVAPATPVVPLLNAEMEFPEMEISVSALMVVGAPHVTVAA